MEPYPLKGYRVVDFGSAWAGAQMTHMLADMGAEVIKVESRTRIDYARLGGAPTPKDLLDKSPEAIALAYPDHLEMNPLFHMLNRGKRGITVDFTKPQGTALLQELIKKSDVVADNYTPGVLDKYGLGYDSLEAIKSDIIVVSLCLAGHTGPLKGTRGYAPIITAISGLDSMVGYSDEPTPSGTRFAFGDHVSAAHGALAILMALIYRNRTGEGQYVDISEWEAVTSLLGEPLMDYFMNGRIQGPTGNRSSDMAPHGFYPCKGEHGWVSIAIKTDEEWQNFCQAIGRPVWTEDERFSDTDHRLRNQDALDELVGEWTADYTSQEVTEVLQRSGVAAAPFMTSKAQHSDPHFRERETFVEVDHPKIGAETLYGTAWKLSETPGEVCRSAPILGQDNDYVFRQLLGMSQADFDLLVEEKVIY